jgi:hypothetical protein
MTWDGRWSSEKVHRFNTMAALQTVRVFREVSAITYGLEPE